MAGGHDIPAGRVGGIPAHRTGAPGDRASLDDRAVRRQAPDRQIASLVFEIEDFKERSLTNNRSPKPGIYTNPVSQSGGVDQ